MNVTKTRHLRPGTNAWGGIALTGIVLTGIALTGCGSDEDATSVEPASIEFVARVGNQAAACGDSYTSMGTGGESVELSDLRFYVTNVQLETAGGDLVDVSLVEDGVWQLEDVALLDFEDGTAGCAESGTFETNTALRASLPPGDYAGIRFELGVPFEKNHDDLAASPSPLNVSSMFWAWQIGHKFARIDLNVMGAARWNFHLGSTMCTSSGPMEAPEAECGRPNRPRVALSGFDPLSSPVLLDVEALFADSDLAANMPETPPGCQSRPDEGADCEAVFPNLGLDFATGACVGDCEAQSLFRVE